MVGNTSLCMALVQAAVKAGLGPGGAMVNISAIGTRKLYAPAAAYGASKAALDVLTRSLALELAPCGIRVNAVAPGLVRTPATEFLLADRDMESRQKAAVPLGRIGRPEDIANGVAYLLSDEAAYITGVVLDVDGGSLMSSLASTTAEHEARHVRATHASQHLSAIPNRDRRAWHSLHSRPFAARRRLPGRDDPWLAGIDRRVSQGHRSSD